MRIAIGSDHRGFALKERLAEFLRDAGHEVIDVGCYSAESCDYPLYGIAVGEAVSSGAADRGIAICATGIGMCIAANKVRGVRAALCRTVEDARMTRCHNDSNVLVLSESSNRDPSLEDIVVTWLETPFDGGRHQRRIDEITRYEEDRMK